MRFVLALKGVFITGYFPVLFSKLAGLGLACCSHRATSLFLNAFTKISVVFKSMLRLELIHTQIQIKSVFRGESLGAICSGLPLSISKNLRATALGPGHQREPLLFWACLFHHRTSFLQTSWGKGDGTPVFSPCCTWGGASAPWVGAGWGKGATDLSATLTRNSTPAAQSWKG